MIRWQTAALAFAAIFLSACNFGPDKRYLESTLERDLEIPPDLATFEVESRFELPEGFSGDNPDERDKIPVLAKVDSIQLESSGDMHWLSLEEPVDNLYQLVKQFWNSEGYRLEVDEPIIGVMETEWIFKEAGTEREDTNFLEDFIGDFFGTDDFSATQDQFKTRIQRGEDGRNQVFIAHRGTEYIYQIEYGDAEVSPTGSESEDDIWRFREPDPELEIEMLSRLMVFLGLKKSEADQKVADIKLFAPRASLHQDIEENSPYLILKDPYQIAWNRVYHQLERMDFEIADSSFKSGVLNKGFIKINTEIVDVAEGGGFFSLFSSPEPEARQIVLVLSEETNELTRVNIETADREYDTSAAGNEFMTLLLQQIK